MPVGSGRVSLGFLGVDAAGRGLPPVPAGLRLGDVPAGRLLDAMTGAAACTGVAGTGLAALVVRLGVLPIRLTGVAVAGRERARAVADLDQVAEPVARLVAAGLIPV